MKEDIESELAVIHSQMAYVMQLQGRTDEALQLYNQVIKLKPSDVGLLAVTPTTSHNKQVGPKCVDSKKKVKLTTLKVLNTNWPRSSCRPSSSTKLCWPCTQTRPTSAGNCHPVFSLRTRVTPPLLIQVAQLCREKQHSRAIELLQQFSDQHPESASGIKLTMAQLYLYKVTNKSLRPLVTMYSHEEDIDSAIDVFKQAIGHYQSEQPGSAAHLALVREAANYKLKYGRKRKPSVTWSSCGSEQNTNAIHTLAQLISAYSLVDTDKAKSLSKHLPSARHHVLQRGRGRAKTHMEPLRQKKAAKVPEKICPRTRPGEIKKKKKKKKVMPVRRPVAPPPPPDRVCVRLLCKPPAATWSRRGSRNLRPRGPRVEGTTEEEEGGKGAGSREERRRSHWQ
ncbi:hypothetical protein INR49_032766, partial [Caranx melampygus]